MPSLATRPTERQVLGWLRQVPDPEIPVISVVDLGILRNVAWDGDTLVVTLTPTYSGCPATSVIAMDVERALRARGLKNVRIKTQLSPAWTTAWISREGRERLKAFGIAPPVEGASCAGALRRLPPVAVECPRCASRDTECISAFGSTPCKASYRCHNCLEPFDYFKSF